MNDPDTLLTLAGLSYASAVAAVCCNYHPDAFESGAPRLSILALTVALSVAAWLVVRLFGSLSPHLSTLAVFAVVIGGWPAVIGYSSRPRWAKRYAAAALVVSAVVITAAQN